MVPRPPAVAPARPLPYDRAMSRLYPERPIVGVGAVIFRGEEVLLIRRGKPPRVGQWSLPGGAQQLGESVAEAVRREVREEAGIEIALGEIVAIVDALTPERDGRIRYHYTLVDFVAEWQAGEARAGDDAAAVAWVPLGALASYGLWHETERVIGHAAARRPATAEGPATVLLVGRAANVAPSEKSPGPDPCLPRPTNL